MRKTITIGKEVFTVKKAISGNENTKNYIGYSNIFKAYKTPSIYKIEIWEDWHTTLKNNGAYNIGVNSKNYNIFTISFMIEIDGTKYIGYITPTRQELTPVNMTV